MNLSVIIPVYNVSQFLDECMKSVCTQSLSHIEIICVNDGSIDESLEILKKYQKKDSRIVILTQQNNGVSAARNAGLKVAKGKYIGFLDGDDTIAPDFFLKLVQNAEKYEVDAVYSSLSSQDIPTVVYKNNNFVKTLIPEFIYSDRHNSVCTKLFRNDIIQKHQLEFPIGIKHGEDAFFNIKFLLKASAISVVDFCGYYYREVEGSATRNIAAHDYLTQIMEVYQRDWEPIIAERISPQDLVRMRKIRFINAIISLVFIYGNRGNGLTDRQRILKLTKIVQHETVKEVFGDDLLFDKLELNRYSIAIVSHIKRRNFFMLYLLTQYSYYRNMKIVETNKLRTNK